MNGLLIVGWWHANANNAYAPLVLIGALLFLFLALMLAPPPSSLSRSREDLPVAAAAADADERCSRSRFGERPAVPEVVTGLNGVAYPRGFYDGKEEKGAAYHVFVIGDWGGILEDEKVEDGDGDEPGNNGNRRDSLRLHTFLGHSRGLGVDQTAQHRVRDRMVQLAADVDPEFVLNVGDSFYPGGIAEHCLGRRSDVDFGKMPEQFRVGYEEFYAGPGLDGKEWLGVLGNHDYGGVCHNMGWPQQIWYTWNEHELSTGRWVMPAQYYSRRATFATSSDAGADITADMFFLDTNFYDTVTQHEHDICGVNGNMHNEDAPPGEENGWHCAGYLGDWEAHDNNGVCEGTGYASPDSCGSTFEKLWHEQLDWLETGLNASDADWQIIVTHYPPYYDEIARKIRPLAKKYGVDLIVTGHVHDQELYYGTEVHGQDWGGTAIIVSGGGGGIISEPAEGVPSPDGRDNMYGFMDLAITKETITVSGYSWNVENQTITVTSGGVPGIDPTKSDGVPKCVGAYHQGVGDLSHFMGHARYEGGRNNQCVIYYSKNSTLGWVLNDNNSEPELGDWVSSGGNNYKITNGMWRTNPIRPDAPFYKISTSQGSMIRMLHAEVTMVARDDTAGGREIKGESGLNPCDASCKSRGASYTCRDRVERIAWDANKGGPPYAVQTVNTECIGQCECEMPIAEYIVAKVPMAETKRFVSQKFGPCEENEDLCKAMQNIPYFYVRWRGFNLLDHTSIEWSDEYPSGTMPKALVKELFQQLINLETDEYKERIRKWAPKHARETLLQT